MINSFHLNGVEKFIIAVDVAGTKLNRTHKNLSKTKRSLKKLYQLQR